MFDAARAKRLHLSQMYEYICKMAPDVGNNGGNLALIYYLCPEYTDMAWNFGRVGGGLAQGCGF